jgi:two-component system sensor histidine kinase KdpD
LIASPTSESINWLRLLIAVAVPLGASSLLPSYFSQANIVMLFLLSVSFLSARAGRRETTIAVLLSVLTFDLFFVHPVFSLKVSDVQYILTFVVMLVVGLSINALTHKVREQAEIETKNSLLSAVSHDLRTPLTSIHGASSALLEQPEMDAETRSMLLRSIVDESNRLNRLVSNVLDLTRIEGASISLKRQLCPLSELAYSGMQATENALSGLTVDLSNIEEPGLVAVDEILITQVFINLFENAGKYVPAPGKLKVSAKSSYNQMTIVVEDSGPGIPRDIRKKVFEPFYRGSSKNVGAGLGLGICKTIIKAHGGTLNVTESELGGAKFVFTLPTEL